MGRLRPEVQPLTLLYNAIFQEKGTPFVYLLWYPFHIPCLELCIPFNCCKCTVFELGINLKNRTFSRLFAAIKFMC